MVLSHPARRVRRCSFSLRAAAIALTALTLLPVLSVPPARAVPAWARRTGMPCMSCHFGGTSRLTAAGIDFLLRGHRMRGETGIGAGAAAAGTSSEAAQPQKPLSLTDYLSLSSKFRYAASGTSGFDVQNLSAYAGGPMIGKTSFFLLYDFHDRSRPTAASGGSRSGLAEGYLQYNTAPTAPSFFWARAGQIAPFAIYLYGSGGRAPGSRPVVITEALGAQNRRTLRDRLYGVSAGYVHESGWRAEAGAVNGDDGGNEQSIFASVERDFDEYGSGLGVFATDGRYRIPGTGAAASMDWEDRYYRTGFLGQFVRENLEVSGAYFTGRSRITGMGTRRPDGYYAETAYNILPELTGFVRYDRNNADPGPTITGATLGLSCRLPDMGRAVLELGGVRRSGGRYIRQAAAEIIWMF